MDVEISNVQIAFLLNHSFTIHDFVYHCIFSITATFNGLPSLKKLSLSSQKLTELREGMFLALTSLDSLNLGWNSIEHIGPNSFKGIPKLKDLQLFGNKLISLSVDSFRGLSNLEGLNVGGMCILTIESGFLQNLPKLHSLHLTPRNLTVLQKDSFTGHSTGLKIYLSRYWQCSDDYWKCSLDECWMVREIQEGILSLPGQARNPGTGAFFNFDNPSQRKPTCRQSDRSVSIKIEDMTASKMGCFLNEQVEITNVSPKRGSGAYGPLSGGTVVTVTGHNLDLTGPPRVKLGVNRIQQIECNVVSTSNIQISFKTPALPSKYDWINKELQITFIWPAEGHPLTNGILESEFTFIYLPDPVIQNFYPRQTIVSGGLELTVTGTNMDSVSNPIMEINVFMAGAIIGTHYEDCRLGNGTEFYCPTPNLNNYTRDSLTRGKRTTGSSCNTLPMGDDELYQYKIANQVIHVTINFILDNVAAFNDFNGCLNVFHDPVIISFGGNFDDRKFRPFWPFNDKHISITGEHLLVGLEPWFYIVTIGKEVCDGITVYDTEITCMPPTSEPNRHNLYEDHPAVKVHIGRDISKSVGGLDYDEHIFQYLPVQIGTGILGLLLIITCIVVYKCGKCFGKRKAKNKQKEKSEENEMGISSPAAMENREISSRYIKSPENEASVTQASRYLHPPTDSEKHNYLDLL